MRPVAYRVGILAALLSLHEGGKWIGVMITASHNPIDDNGVKLVDPQGEMIVGEWESLASELANLPESELQARVSELITTATADKTQIKVAIARDTRPSGLELTEAVKAGILSVCSGAEIRDFGLQTTPELHFNTWSLNASNTVGYIEHFSRAFEQLLNGKMLSGQLIIDAANGVGADNVKRFCSRLVASTNFDPILINSTEGILNEGVKLAYFSAFLFTV